MKFKFAKKMVLLTTLLVVDSAHGQLDQVFDDIFNEILVKRLQLSLGEHKDHFVPAAQIASAQLTPALNSLIASNVSSFPLSSTAAGVTFDFSTGQPVSIRESLGPIFSENAGTLGKGKLNFGFNYTYLNLLKFRGNKTEDIRFTFTHEDLVEDGKPLGDNVFELDFIDFELGLDVNASIFAFFATFGITNNFDIGVAVPIVNLELRGTGRAGINGPTAGIFHLFESQDINSPRTQDTVGYGKTATGIGDLAVRLKYNFVSGRDLDLAALLDLRLPSGSEKDFLGTGEVNAKLTGIVSKKINTFTPHVNIAYERKKVLMVKLKTIGGAGDSDELELTFGFDQKVVEGVTFAVDFINEFDINKNEAITFFAKETETLQRQLGPITIQNEVDLTNIPSRDNDNTLNVAFGFRIAPSEQFLFLANILLPLNDGGLRSSIAWTFGFNIAL